MRSASISPFRFRMNFRTRSVSEAALAFSPGSACSCTMAPIASTLASSESSSQAVSSMALSLSAYFARHSGMLYSRLGMAESARTDGGGLLMSSKGLGSSFRWNVSSTPHGMNTNFPSGSR